MANERHLPMRPLWGCDTCRADWPCPAARLALLAEYHNDRIALRVYLAALMAEADGQLSQVGRNADLYRRFLAWV